MENVQRHAPKLPQDGLDDRTVRIAGEAAMIEAALSEVRNGLALPEARIEQWFEQVLGDTRSPRT